MRKINFIAGIVAALVWGMFLFGGMRLVGMIACANLPDFPIVSELMFAVVIPTAVLTLTIVSVGLTTLSPRPVKAIAWFPVAALVLALVYYALVTGTAIAPSATADCPF